MARPITARINPLLLILILLTTAFHLTLPHALGAAVLLDKVAANEEEKLPQKYIRLIIGVAEAFDVID